MFIHFNRLFTKIYDGKENCHWWNIDWCKYELKSEDAHAYVFIARNTWMKRANPNNVFAQINECCGCSQDKNGGMGKRIVRKRQWGRSGVIGRGGITNKNIPQPEKRAKNENDVADLETDMEKEVVENQEPYYIDWVNDLKYGVDMD